MRKALVRIAFPIFAIAAIVYTFNLVTFDGPIYTHRLFIDFADPNRPGHLKGVIVSPQEFWREVAAALVFWTLAVYFFVKARQSFAKPLPLDAALNCGQLPSENTG